MPDSARRGYCSIPAGRYRLDRARGPIAPRRNRRAGFTLMEMIVSLGVIGVATLILVSLFGYSLDIESRANHRLVAANLAEELIVDMRTRPASYAWPAADALASAEFAELTPAGGAPLDEGNPVTAPVTLPPVPAMERAVLNAYSNFKWKAFVRRPEPDLAYYELTVVVSWLDQGRTQSAAVTSLVPAREGA